MTHEALRGDQVGSRLGTDENDEEFDDENYKRLDPRSALGVVAERVSCVCGSPCFRHAMLRTQVCT